MHCHYLKQPRDLSNKAQYILNNSRNISDGYCKGTHLQNLLPPTFMTTDTATTDMIPSGVYIYYRCRDEVNKMLPPNKDPPYENFMMDIKCERSATLESYISHSNHS